MRAAGAPAIATKVQRSLIGLQVLVVVVYLIGLLWPRPEWDGLTNSWLSWISQSIPALICWSALPTAGVRRVEVALLATGLTLYGAGDAWFAFVAYSDAGAAFHQGKHDLAPDTVSSAGDDEDLVCDLHQLPFSSVYRGARQLHGRLGGTGTLRPKVPPSEWDLRPYWGSRTPLSVAT